MTNSAETANRQTPRFALAFIFATVLLDMVGFGLIIPVLPELIGQVGKTDIAQASIIGGWMFFAFSATQFLFGPALGSLSDHFGRRPLLLLAVARLGVDYLLHALAPNLAWLFIGRIIAGFCGASYVIANAYIADITPPDQRAKAFGMMGAAFGIGFVVGPAIGGLLGQFGPRVPFYVAAAVSFLNLLFGYFAVPETLSTANRRAFDWARANPIGTFKVFASYRGVLPISIILFVYFFATSVYPALWAYWSIARFGWGPSTIGLTLAFFGITMAAVQGGLTGPAVKMFGESKLVIIGSIAAILAAIGYGLAPGLITVLVLLLVHAPEGFIHPMLTALASREAPEDAQGELQGGFSSVMSIAMLLGTVFFTQLFGYVVRAENIGITTGIPFFIASILLVAGLLLFLRYQKLHQTVTKAV